NGRDPLSGDNGNDTVEGGDGAHALYGDTGNDSLSGGANDDALHGGRGYDQLYGGVGNDTLEGDLGADSLWGNGGADRFVFSESDFGFRWDQTVFSIDPTNTDTIEDFEVGRDVIDLTTFGAFPIPGLIFSFANDFFSGQHRSELLISGGGGHYSVRGDIDGDGHADFEINVEMTHFDDVLTPADILL